MGKRASDAKTAMVKKSKATFGASSTAGLVQSKHAFPFDKLPPELRNKIYRLVLVTAEGPIEIIGRINVKHRDLSRQPCSCYRRTLFECSRCKGLAETEAYDFEAKTLAIGGKKSRRKPLMKKAYGGGVLSINRQAHQEAAAILYGENVFVFSSYSVFQRFSNKIGRKIALLRDIEIMNLPPRSGADFFSTFPTDCTLQRLKIWASSALFIGPNSVLKLLLPLIAKSGTQGCRCESMTNGTCFCRTAEQEREFACIDVSDFDWDDFKDPVPGVQDETNSVLLYKRWSDRTKVVASDR
ncbi:hypothetical protein LTR29_001985 [Friedmanniomyces endolithicus]|nr:hypothetical protein LTR29_001985 [Friedmanniomyces endolithicus]